MPPVSIWFILKKLKDVLDMVFIEHIHKIGTLVNEKIQEQKQMKYLLEIKI